MDISKPRTLAGLCVRHLLLQELRDDPEITMESFKGNVAQLLRSKGGEAEASECIDPILVAAGDEHFRMQESRRKFTRGEYAGPNLYGPYKNYWAWRCSLTGVAPY